MATQWKDSRGRSRQDRKGGKGQEKKGKEIRDGIPTIGEYSKGIASGETQRLARWGTAIVLKGGYICFRECINMFLNNFQFDFQLTNFRQKS